MLIEISVITIGHGRRAALPDHVKKMADSMAEVGLLSPITVDKRHTLIAGLHRLEAAKLLGWTEIECNVSDLDGLQAELAEIDENFVRKDVAPIEQGDLLLRRKEIYETLHPDSRATFEGGGFRGNQHQREVGDTVTGTTKSFTRDTAEKLGISPRTVERHVQIARDLSPDAKKIIKSADTPITQRNVLKLSRLEPEQQVEAATLLVDGKIRKVDEYTATQSEADQADKAEAEPDVPPFQIGGQQFSTFAEGVADLKNTEKDFRCTPDDFLAEVTAFARKFHQEIEWYSTPYYEEVYPTLSPEQLAYLRRQTDSISAAAEQLYINVVKGRAIP